MVVSLVLLIVGLALLLAGAELLVRGASQLAVSLGISPLVVGLTVVSYGTSAPELAIGIGAALDGQPDIVLGNVVGSNIANVLLILGLAALVAPLVVTRRLVWLDVPIMVAISLLVTLLALDGHLERWLGAALLLGSLGYTCLQLVLGRREGAAMAQAVGAPEPASSPRWRNVLWVLLGLCLLALGAQWLVDGAVSIAQALGVSELVIGLTVVAVGTSLPEIAATLAAVRRGQSDMAVGNIVGSNLFNLMLVLGSVVAISPGGLAVGEAAVHFDLPVMTAVAVACLPIFFTGHRIGRREGALFLGYYIAYIAFLVLSAIGHPALPALRNVMMLFVLPLTALGLGLAAIGALRAERRAGRR